MFRITLIGPDGSGKTAVAEQLLERLQIPARRIYMGVNLEASNVMLPTARLQRWIRRCRGTAADNAGPRDPHQRTARPRSAWQRAQRFCKAAFRTMHLIADETYRLGVIRWWLWRGYVVVQDRDYFVDYYEYDIAAEDRNFWQRVHGFFLQHTYSRPQLTLLLDVPPETMQARKGEGTAAALARRRLFYQQFLKEMPHAMSIDASRSLPDVTTDCHDRLMQFRTDVRSGLRSLPRRSNDTQRSSDSPRNDARPLAPVILIGLDCVTGLQSARLLNARGIRVIGLAARPTHFCCRTNAVERLVVSETSGPGLLETLQHLHAEFRQQPVLLPCTDLAVMTISACRDQLASSYRFVLPEHELLQQLIDKVHFSAFAEAHDLPVPRTRILSDQESADRAARELTFPVFLKPAVKTQRWELNTAFKAIRTESPEDLRSAWQKYSAFSDQLIAQEYIHGTISDCFTINVYFDRDGQLRQQYTSQKDRQWPPDFGTACAAHHVRNEEATAVAVRFFQTLNYRGLGYLELKRDQRTGQFLIIEPNIGRPTGRSAMAEACGVPMLWTAYCDALGPEASEALDWEPSSTAADSQQIDAPELQWIHLRRDFQAAVRAWRRGEASLWQWLNSLRGRRKFAVLDFSDLRPFLTESRHYLLRLLVGKRRAKKREQAAAATTTSTTAVAETQQLIS